MSAIRAILRADGVLVISLNRPEAGNRFDLAMLNELKSALDRARDAHAVLLTHEGTAFCLGGELGDARLQHSGSVQAFAGSLKAVLIGIFTCPVPVVCALEGDAEGGGLSMVQACDMAAASSAARFSIPEIKAGMAPVVSLASAARVLPEKRMMEMALLGERIHAEEAERIGLITRAVKQGTARQQAEIWIRAFLSANDATLGTIRTLRQRVDGGRFQAALDAAGDLLVGVMMHKDTWDMISRREGELSAQKSDC